MPIGDGVDCLACVNAAECACEADPYPCYNDSACYNLANDGASYVCGTCPPGYEGDGVTCTDVDEVGSLC